MLSFIDYRNGRYQGQISNGQPNGAGIFLDKYFLFCIGEWANGCLSGHSIIMFPNGKIFSGQIRDKMPEDICLYEFAEDHAKIYTTIEHGKTQVQKIAAVLPLFKNIQGIVNEGGKTRIQNQFQYSSIDSNQNDEAIKKILSLHNKRITMKLSSYRNFIKYFIDTLLQKYKDVFDFFVSNVNGKKQFIIGLQGGGLGIKVQPIQEITTQKKQSQRVYIIRACGFLTKQNLLKEFGMKTLESTMKGITVQEGIFTLSNTIKRYPIGKRPKSCEMNMINYLKRSLFYRNQIMKSQYIYKIQQYISQFDENHKKAVTQKMAQFVIENPIDNGQIYEQIQKKRREKTKRNQSFVKDKTQTIDTSNAYNPNIKKVTNPTFSLQTVKEDIYRSANKRKQSSPNTKGVDYPKYQYNQRPERASREKSKKIYDSPDIDRRRESPRRYKEYQERTRETPGYYKERTPKKVQNQHPSRNYDQKSPEKSPSKNYSYLDKVNQPEYVRPNKRENNITPILKKSPERQSTTPSKKVTYKYYQQPKRQTVRQPVKQPVRSPPKQYKNIHKNSRKKILTQNIFE